ncbi:MAG: toxin-antitoxin system protein [Gaiellaceae bacterium]
MSGTTVRIREETRETLRDLKEYTGEQTPDILARAVDQFYRRILIAETNIGYAELRASDEWAEEQADRDVWDATLSDGL